MVKIAKETRAVGTAEEFYGDAVKLLAATDVPFMIGGAYALRQYAGVYRDTKDLDVFCVPGDHLRLLAALSDAGYRAESTDARWLAKAFKDDHYIDLIFSSANGTAPVDESWFENAKVCNLFDIEVKIIPAEELIWSKSTVQSRERYDGADINHMIRCMGRELDWQRLLQRMGPNWEVLLQHLISFGFVYPSERDAVPREILDELLSRYQQQLDLPAPQERVCRGPLFARHDYAVDIEEWNYRGI